jgi:homoaconitase/3-isopropylmalate dehydratase large subunit
MNNLENNEIENQEVDVDEISIEEESVSSDVEAIKAENERLRKQNEKLKHKKHKAIEKSTKQAIDRQELEGFYKEMKQKEWFKETHPGVDYQAIKAVAEAKGTDMQEAMKIL